MGYSKEEKTFDELVDTNPMMHLLHGKQKEKFKNPYDEWEYNMLFGPKPKPKDTHLLEAIMPVPEKPDPIEVKIDKLNRRLDYIFGNAVLIHGEFVHVNPLSATKAELKRFIK